MSTSLLYHAFGIRGYDYVRTDYRDGQVIFTIAQDPHDCRCPACGSRDVISRGHAERRFLNVPIGTRPPPSSSPSRASNAAAAGRPPGQGPVRRPAPQLHPGLQTLRPGAVAHMTIKDVAYHLGVGWDTIKDIQKRHLPRRYAKPKLKHLRALAIDEIAVAKGHRYLTVVLDLESGAVVFVGDGKGADALKPFWKRLRPAGRIEAVATDMSRAYRAAVRAHLPGR